MTSKTIEDLLIEHTKTIAKLEVGQENLEERFSEKTESDGTRFDKLGRSVDEDKAEAADLKTRLSLAEREISDLKLLGDRGRSNRWALFLSLLGVVVSSVLSALIAIYLKPK